MSYFKLSSLERQMDRRTLFLNGTSALAAAIAAGRSSIASEPSSGPNESLISSAQTLNLGQQRGMGYARLREFSGIGSVLMLSGDADDNSALAGLFALDLNDNASPDDGGVCIVDKIGRRWKRHYGDHISVKWFGATGNGSTDDSSAIQVAVQSAFLYRVPLFFPAGIYFCSKTITIPGDSMRLYGVSRRTAQIRSSAKVVLTNGTGNKPVNYFCLEHLFLSATEVDAKVFDHTYFKYLHTSDIQIEMVGSDSSGMYAIGTAEGESSYYNVHVDTYIGATGNALRCRGVHYEMLQLKSGTVRGPNSNVWIGGRVVNCLHSVEIEAGNSNTFVGLQSEAVQKGGSDFWLGARAASSSGLVSDATRSSMIDRTANFPNLSNGGVSIVSGKGAGQKRKLISAVGNKAILKTPWDIIPDATSRYEIYAATAINNSIGDFRSEGTLEKNSVIHESLGAYQNYHVGGHVSSNGKGRLIEQEIYDASALYLFSGISSPVRIGFFCEKIAAGQKSIPLLAGGGSSQIVLDTDGEIVGMTVCMNASRKRGVLTLEATVNGAGTGFLLNIDEAHDDGNVKYAAWGDFPLGGRGRRIGVRATASGDWGPIDNSLSVQIIILPRN